LIWRVSSLCSAIRVRTPSPEALRRVLTSFRPRVT